MAELNMSLAWRCMESLYLGNLGSMARIVALIFLMKIQFMGTVTDNTRTYKNETVNTNRTDMKIVDSFPLY